MFAVPWHDHVIVGTDANTRIYKQNGSTWSLVETLHKAADEVMIEYYNETVGLCRGEHRDFAPAVCRETSSTSAKAR